MTAAGQYANFALAPLALLLLALPALRRGSGRAEIALIVAIALINNLATLLPLFFPSLQIPGTHWNWTGKLAATAAMLAIAVALIASRRFTARDLGLTLRQAPGTGRVLLCVVLPYFVILAILNATLFGDTVRPTAETLAFQATMPGLAEELAWRGLLLALFDRLFPERFRLWGVPAGLGLIATSLVFGLIHALQFGDEMALHVAVMGGMLAGLTGFLFGWLRLRTGSLVVPVIVHNVTNLILNAVPLLLT